MTRRIRISRQAEPTVAIGLSSHSSKASRPEQQPERSQQTAGNLAVQHSLRCDDHSVVHDAVQASGHPLEPADRSLMEARFNRDFSKVRVHTDAKAAGAAEILQARAFTVGQNIAFGAGEYAPGTLDSTRLLAHELTHTIQQEGGHNAPESRAKVSEPNDRAEREADIVADRVLDGRTIDSPITPDSETIHLQQSPSRAGGFRDPALPWPSARGRTIYFVTENIVTPEWLTIQGYRLVSGPSWPQHWVHTVTHDEVWRLRQVKDTDKPREQPRSETSASQPREPPAVTATYQCDFLTVYVKELEKELAELWKMQRSKDPRTKERLKEFWRRLSDLDDRLDDAQAQFSKWDENANEDEQPALDEQESCIMRLRDRYQKNLTKTPSGDF
jgi:Domain of unknown function (DUF4157)